MSLVEKLKIRIYARISSVFKFKYELHSNIVELVENYVRIQRITRMIFLIEIIFCLREIKTYLWVHYLGEYHISIWLRIFLRSNNRRYHERAHYHCLYTSRSIGLWSQNASSPQMEVNRNRVLGSLPMWLRSWNDISPTFKSCLAPFRL